MNKKINKKTYKWLCLVLLLAALAGLVCFALRAQRRADTETVENAGKALNGVASPTTLSNGSQTARLRSGMDTLLLIGTDRIDGKDGTSPDDSYNFNYDLADFLVLLAFDHNARTVQPLQINRDTMAEVPWIALNGGLGGYETEQITYAHTYGTGGRDSCENTTLAVSKLLFDAPVNRYVSVTMDAVPLVNDLVGGVTIECREAIPQLGEEYVPGALVTLRGQNALRFLRYRDTSLTDSNLQRMERHRAYLQAFLPQARKAMAADDALVMKALDRVGEYLVSDMSGNELAQYVSLLDTYELLPVLTYDGRYELGEYAEFYADPASLWDCVTAAFCEPAK